MIEGREKGVFRMAVDKFRLFSPSEGSANAYASVQAFLACFVFTNTGSTRLTAPSRRLEFHDIEVCTRWRCHISRRALAWSSKSNRIAQNRRSPCIWDQDPAREYHPTPSRSTYQLTACVLSSVLSASIAMGTCQTGHCIQSRACVCVRVPGAWLTNARSF